MFIVVLAFLATTIVPTFGQNSDNTLSEDSPKPRGIKSFLNKIMEVDTNYIELNRYNCTVMMQGEKRYSFYRLSAKNEEGHRQQLDFMPSSPFKVGPYIGYSFLFLGYTFDMGAKRYSFDRTNFYLSIYSRLFGVDYYYESGTQNTCGLAGLCAGVRYILERSVSNIFHEEQRMLQLLIDGLSAIDGVTVYGPLSGPRAAALSFNLDGMDCADVAMILETYYGISVRSGLQCAPDAHRMLGTFDLNGTVRVSPGLFTSPEEIDAFLDAIREIAEEA